MEVILRAHHIFCIQGFRGKGYNEEFISNMKKIIARINKDTGIKVKIVNNPDNICSACPKNIGQCENERYIINLDNMVIDTLGIESDSKYVYSELLELIRINLTKEKLEDICGACKWYSLGYCIEGLLSKSKN